MARPKGSKNRKPEVIQKGLTKEKPKAIIRYELSRNLSNCTKWLYDNNNKYLVYPAYEDDFIKQFLSLHVELVKLNDLKISFIESID